MPSLFSRLAAAAGATCDAVFSEGFVLEPYAPPETPTGRRAVNARPQPSASGQVLAFVGTFVARGSVLHAHGRGMADGTTRGIAAESPMIDIAVGALPTPPLQGWIVRRSDTGEVFEVTKYLPADLGRAWIHLIEKRSAAVPEP
ncbi:hypothetical protein MKK70_22185 [Methylobacterium sp. E-041]|uniref:hypothetical protein n=1 Tax=Methylobacterium sp. E-041 TaxID=2836573 RepID=UPI001FBB6CB3|nr:hypothetical protein [Methylobacterium sp. E-041]MCJ2108033.1 hypothetical protein [Methylobacterium sp. E-041]